MRVVRRHPVAPRQGRARTAGRQPRDMFRVPDCVRAAARAADHGTAGAGRGTGLRSRLEEVDPRRMTRRGNFALPQSCSRFTSSSWPWTAATRAPVIRSFTCDGVSSSSACMMMAASSRVGAPRALHFEAFPPTTPRYISGNWMSTGSGTDPGTGEWYLPRDPLFRWAPRESNSAPTDYESAALTRHELEARAAIIDSQPGPTGGGRTSLPQAGSCDRDQASLRSPRPQTTHSISPGATLGPVPRNTSYLPYPCPTPLRSTTLPGQHDQRRSPPPSVPSHPPPGCSNPKQPQRVRVGDQVLRFHASSCRPGDGDRPHAGRRTIRMLPSDEAHCGAARAALERHKRRKLITCRRSSAHGACAGQRRSQRRSSMRRIRPDLEPLPREPQPQQQAAAAAACALSEPHSARTG